ncbi:L-arabinose transport system permease protein AraQ [Paenibacillus allorhizoplanae]|uniref:L-arabinose transport system permease protein AraQ n=1 Tax=Paenibacillus allorhizoplanae TaxID=2905648 RepID=A0ABN8GS61_9BACL|nr:carbohydrate ABC transporter permease [Paenibacillus allorhizoplanae]CAH1216746.1 L-arabinose transport system permease protein AraQ [Paenibacillus allorhizoplanae]
MSNSKSALHKPSAISMLNPIGLILISLIMVLPILNIIAQSFSGPVALSAGKVVLWPVQFTVDNYVTVLKQIAIWRAFSVSVIITVFGTLISLIMTASLAYPLSRNEYRERKYILLLVLITMIFHAPLIPNYLLVRNLGLLDSLWALMLPGAISAFNLFVMRSFFLSIPGELIESARIDGAGEIRTIWSIILPLSKPAMATMSIIYSVALWNNYSNALYFINNRALFPLQVKLREFVVTDSSDLANTAGDIANLSPEGLKMAVIVIATIPIMLVYPFLQKHFIKGMLIGSIKS